ncbi:ATP-binding protein [Saccharopolyspora taberi]|uniref:BTAD domain-containing putative transcriptional regulator n=1 Tax=Saccharopolyspora taberi TaxID=60895 RepID=A0ABN3VCA3_9PSEU
MSVIAMIPAGAADAAVAGVICVMICRSGGGETGSAVPEISAKLGGVRLALLGPFQLFAADGRPIEIGGARVRMLLARLALAAGRSTSTETLIDDLWGAAPPTGALNALQSLVSRARRALPADVPLRSTSTGYALELDADSVDVHRFARLAAEGRRLLRDGGPAPAAEALREALRLWRGEPLLDFVDSPFAAAEAARLAELRLSALADRVEADLRAGRGSELVAELGGLRAAHPTSERFAALHLRALLAAGRRADALAAYDGLRRRLADELGTDPSPELQELHAAMLHGESVDPKEDAELVLPTRLSSFVGRETEIEQVRTELERSRLVTLFGPGGAGKTRLAVETAAGTSGRRWFVELAPVRQDEDLVSAVLTAVGVRDGRLLETAHTDALTRLVEVFSAGPGLLVLDNCEHVIGAAAQFVHELLGWCPGLRVLATSREPLALTGEALLPVGPLGLPDGGAPEDSDAVRLFADRARAARPDFALDERTIGDVVEICRRLDGMPLAIELAAARLRAMGVRQVAARLDDRFRLLTSGNRTSMPRHRTLRAVVEWSWDLLEKPERVLARRLSVFAGAVRPESVAEVCGDAELPAEDVFYVLASLVEKSFVEAVDGDRYRMLETVRAYCDDRLVEAGERDRVRTAHAEHFLAASERAAAGLHTADQIEWLQRLDADQDNVLIALHWAISTEDADRAVRFCAALAWYWSMSARQGELTARLDAASALPGQAPADARALVELMRAVMADKKGWTERTRDAVTRVRDSGAMRRYLHAAVMEPVAWMMVGDHEAMADSVQRALAHPDPWARAAGTFARGFGAEHRGDPAAAEEDMRASVRAFREVGDRWGIAQSIGSLAGFRGLRGDHAGAIEALEESAASLRQLRASEDIVPTTVRIGMEHVRSGNLAEGRRRLEEAAAVAESGYAIFNRVTALTALGDTARLAGDHDQARTCFAKAAECLTSSPGDNHPAAQLMFASEARLELDSDDLPAARDRIRRAVEVAMELPVMPLMALLAENAALVLFAEGDQAEAARMLGVAVALRGLLDEGDPEIRALRAKLDTPELRAERARGAALPHEEALAALREAVR